MPALDHHYARESLDVGVHGTSAAVNACLRRQVGLKVIMEPWSRPPRAKRGVRWRVADFFMMLAGILRGGSEPKQGQLAAEVRLGRPLTIRPGTFPAPLGDPRSHACLQGNYIYPYRISSGVHAGEVWVCCVPINELLQATFQCGDPQSLQRPLSVFGSAADQKVQTCSLVNPLSSEREVIPVCVPAPLTAPTAPEVP